MNEDRSKFRFDDKMSDLLREQVMTDPDEMGTPPGDKSEKGSIDDIQFEVKPTELIRYLKKYLVGQEQAIGTVATKICTHFHRMRLEREHEDLPRIVGDVKPNMLLIGPTGVGKTYLIKLIADKLNVPFVKGDATKFSETGYVGGDVEDLIRELVHQVDGNIALAEYGIVYIDEIDKIASSGSWWGPDVSRSGVQRNLLKLMEETEVDMKVPHDLASQMEAVLETQRAGKAVRKKVNTRNILFVMSGAFSGMPEIIARRLKKGGMGFTGEEMTSAAEVNTLWPQLHTQDLIQYGFESEFVGRVPVVTYLDELTEDGLFSILKNPQGAVIAAKKRDFAAYGIKLTFDDDALRLFASEANQHGTGARGLVSVVEKYMMRFETELPSTSVKRLDLTKQFCLNPEDSIKMLVSEHDFETYLKEFKEETGIQLEISEAAREIAERNAVEKSQTIYKYLKEVLKDYAYGLKLAGRDRFAVTRSVLNDPKKYLDELIKKSYKGAEE
ncbi:AAA family ATPase [Calditrichota bacterium]